MFEIRNKPIMEKTYGVKTRAKQKGHLPCISPTPVWSWAPHMVLQCLPGTECRAMNLQEHYQEKSQHYKTRATRHMCNSPLSLCRDPQGNPQSYLADGFFRRRFSSSSCAGCQGRGGLHNRGGHLGLHGSSCRLSSHRGRHFTDQSHIAHYDDVGIIFGCHIQNFQAIVVEPRELALERLALFLPANYYGGLAIEDCELTPCENNITYMQKCWLWTL